MKASVDAVFMWEAMIEDGTKVTFGTDKLCKDRVSFPCETLSIRASFGFDRGLKYRGTVRVATY